MIRIRWGRRQCRIHQPVFRQSTLQHRRELENPQPMANGHSPITENTHLPRRPVPDRLVVLTFDDAVSNHALFVAPLLARHGFGGTFFICEFPPDFETNKTQYMTWEQIRSLHDQGFDVGNHTGHHRAFRGLSPETMIDEIEYIERRFREHGIGFPTSFCYPENAVDVAALPILAGKGYRFARCGEERAYSPMADHPLQVPSLGVHGTDPRVFYDAVSHAREGRIAVLMFHGVPEHTHPWVSTPAELFEEYLRYLRDNAYTVISMRDLREYVDTRDALSA